MDKSAFVSRIEPAAAPIFTRARAGNRTVAHAKNARFSSKTARFSQKFASFRAFCRNSIQPAVEIRLNSFAGGHRDGAKKRPERPIS
jgi:hypothetical protein